MMNVVAIDLEETLMPSLSDLCILIERQIAWDLHKNAISELTSSEQFNKIYLQIKSSERFNASRANLYSDLHRATRSIDLAERCAEKIPDVHTEHMQDIDFGNYFTKNPDAQKYVRGHL
jgi:hypothetical protein